MRKIYSKYSSIIFFSILSFSPTTKAQILWPQGQLLPTFPSSAETQDLIYLNGSTPIYAKTWTWQAESDAISHATGRLDDNEWICEVGIDTPNQFMVYGPYDKNVTSGPNVAEFRLMIDNNSTNNDTVVDLNVKNTSTGNVLATRKITRQQFTATDSYVSFRLDFHMPTDSQAIELQIFWRGNANIGVDYVSVKQNNNDAEMYLFSSLKGLVNRTQPRIFSYEGDVFAEGPYTWLNSLGVKYRENKSNNLNTLNKYLSEISGLVIYDPAQIHTVNLAATIAGRKNALVCAPSFLSLLTSAPYNLPILDDLRGKFTEKIQVYQTLFDTYWAEIDKRILIGLSPTYHKASLREYAVALGAAVVWLDPKVTAESNMLNQFFSSMPPGANYMGWWPEEEPGITRGSAFGITTIASDYCSNLTFHSGMPGTIEAKPMPAKPELQNKIYVSFVLSDGDNLQYVEHLLRKLWNNPDRGSVPIGWTMSPAMVDAMPGALNYYHKSSTVNDNLISGPSGYGYTYPNYWTDLDALDNFAAKTEEYNVQAGFRVVTIWNTITGGISRNTGTSFSNHAPTLLGMTAQNTGGLLSIYNASIPGMPLSCNYCTNEQAMKNHIASASSNWSGNSPKFVIIQAQPWNGVTPTSFKNVMNSLDSRYEVVRPDHIFQLIREANNLSVNPGAVEGNGTGLTGTYFNGSNFETEIATRIDNNIAFDWGAESPISGVNTNGFSVRWTGQIQPRYSGNYTFYLTSDNGSRIWIDDQLIIDSWSGLSGATYSGTMALTAGKKHNIKVEYFENAGSANCKLEWASPFQSREIIPQSQLYKNTDDTGITGLASSVGLEIFPNPSDDGIVNIKIDNDLAEPSVLSIHNVFGEEMMRETIKYSQQLLDISKLPKGVYLFSLHSKTNTKSILHVVQ
ncbi:MAG: PA14 domain-containing protein [Paludibacteraceae bacterium]